MPPHTAVIGSATVPATAVRPFLKWAGGKRQLLPVLRRFYPARFERYFEPFLGSGAVFFDLYNRGLLRNRPSVLIDNNRDLIGCYSAIRDHVDAVVRELEGLAREHRRGGAQFFYEIRDREFNPARERLVSSDRLKRYPPRLAALLIYLNRTGFNGLFRLNAAGRFNVPAGRYVNPKICDAENLRHVSAALNDRVALRHGSFDEVRGLAGRGDLLYFDPPYAPVSRTARFTSYTSSQFGSEEQRRLYQLVLELARAGCFVIVSNSTAEEIQQLYESRSSKAAALTAHRVQAKRAINSKPDARGSVSEYVLANTPTGSRR
jgi:DNA adenine methylase